MSAAIVIDTCVHPFFRSNAEIREYLPPSFRNRGFPDVERPWYQAPGGDYAQHLYGDASEGRKASIVGQESVTACLHGSGQVQRIT